MGFEFHPDQWVALFQHNPVLIVLLAGSLGGAAATQLVKVIYMAWFIVPTLGPARYRASVRLLAVLTTFLLTNWMWMNVIGNTGTGLHTVVSVISGLLSPILYSVTKAVIAWKWPALARLLGDNGAHWGDK